VYGGILPRSFLCGKRNAQSCHGCKPARQLGARGKRRGYSHGTAVRHSHSAKFHTNSRQKHFFHQNSRLTDGRLTNPKYRFNKTKQHIHTLGYAQPCARPGWRENEATKWSTNRMDHKMHGTGMGRRKMEKNQKKNLKTNRKKINKHDENKNKDINMHVLKNLNTMIMIDQKIWSENLKMMKKIGFDCCK